MHQTQDSADERPLFYVVDWLPPDFGAVGQYALIAATRMAEDGRRVCLVGLTRGDSTTTNIPVANGTLTVRRLHARTYEKDRFFRRLLWTVTTNIRLVRAVAGAPGARGADLIFTGAPPFMLYFALALKYLRGARLTYRITDFYPEAIIAHLGRRTTLLALAERLTWVLRRRVDRFEVLSEDQRTLLLRGGIAADRIALKRDGAPVALTGHETPAAKPAILIGRKVLLYSGNYGVAHEMATVAQGLARHHRGGNGRFALWLNATGRNADALERHLAATATPVARTAPVALADFGALLAAADAHLITLRAGFAGIVFPSKVYACIQSGRPIVFVGPPESDVHLLCSAAGQRYIHVMPGDAAGLARALDMLGLEV